ncbi:MAG: hypothetical protein GVY26_14485 [Bacteroidetes bacterium]|jgi:hypothetical protein|nr:hypothetical protein [Bacteroidota bacterium]
MKGSNRNLKAIIALLLAGLAVGYLAGKILGPLLESQSVQPLWAKIAVLLLLPVVLLLVVFWHEMGHVVAGLQANFNFRFLTVGPFMWEKEEGRLRFYWNKDINTAGGLALLLPDNDQRLPQRFARLAAGGPLASLLLTLLAVLLIVLLPAPDSPPAGLYLLRSALWFIAVVSGFIMLVTAIPFHTGGFYSDGARVLRLLRGGPTARLESLLLTLIARATGGTRPRDLDPAIFEEGIALAKAQEAPFEPYFYQYQYFQKLDQGKYEEAEAALGRFAATSDRMPPVMQQSLRLERAFFAAFLQKDLETAVEERGDFQPSRLFPRTQVALVDAAIAQLRGQPERVKQLCQEALDQSDKVMDRGMAQLYREWAEKLLREADQPNGTVAN